MPDARRAGERSATDEAGRSQVPAAQEVSERPDFGRCGPEQRHRPTEIRAELCTTIDVTRLLGPANSTVRHRNQVDNGEDGDRGLTLQEPPEVKGEPGATDREAELAVASTMLMTGWSAGAPPNP
jgi:hypothetical protein